MHQTRSVPPSRQRAAGAWQCSGALRVTDPCYARASTARRLAGVVLAAPGPWHSRVTRGEDGTVGALTTWAGSAAEPDSAAAPDKACRWEDADFRAAVDSGQCGVFDDAAYPAGETTGECDEPETFYGRACAATRAGGFGLVPGGAGRAPVGVASLAGDGDGVYKVRLRREGAAVTAVQVVFTGEGAPA